MATTPLSSRPVRRAPPRPDVSALPALPPARHAPRRIASNFAALSVAEVACRGTSVAVTLSLAKRLGTAGYGRIEFAFNVVFWLVLLVRDGLEVIAARELARHPRLIRPLVNHVLAVKGVLALGLFAGLVAVGSFTLSDAGRPGDPVALRPDAPDDRAGAGLRLPGHGADGAGGASRCCDPDAGLRRRGLALGGRRLADRLGAGLAGRWARRAGSRWSGLLHPAVRPAPSGAGWSVPAGLPPPGAAGLPDPGRADGDRLGRPDGRRPDEPVGRRGPLRRPAPDGHGGPDVRADLPAGRLPHPGAVVAADAGRGPAGAGRPGPGAGAGPGAGGRRGDGPGRAAGPLPPPGRVCRGRPAAGPGDLAGAAVDAGLSSTRRR